MEKLMNTQADVKTTKWSIDPLHSEVLFKIKHLVISTVTGSFTKFHTGQEQRDAHLKNSDFFEIEKYPTISFVSSSFIKTDESQYILTGNLTMKGVTKEVSFDAEYGGTEKDHYGNTKAGFELSGIINRKEFGLSFNSLTESGGLALGENVKIAANIQLARQ
jgi:polyisoprenoid-binding protein YceI